VQTTGIRVQSGPGSEGVGEKGLGFEVNGMIGMNGREMGLALGPFPQSKSPLLRRV
jgi:hypothetical protein